MVPGDQRAKSGQAIWVDAKDEKDLEKYKGKLEGKIVFFGEMRDVEPVDKPLWERRDDANLKTRWSFRYTWGSMKISSRHLSSGWNSARRLEDFSPRNTRLES